MSPAASSGNGPRETDGGAADADGHVRASLLWGLVGALSFLVLVQGYELAGGRGVTVGAKVGVAAAVGVAASGLSYAFGGWLAGREGDG